MIRFIVTSLLLFLLCFSVYSQEKHRGVILFEQGKHDEAAQVLRSAVKSAAGKNDPTMWNYLGLSLNQINKDKEAVKAFQTAVRLNPTSSAFNANAAYAFSLTRQPKKARNYANEAYRLDPTNSVAIYLIASFAYLDSQLDIAETHARKAVEINPKLAAAYRLLADVHMARLGEKLREGSNLTENQIYIDNAINELENGIKNSTDPGPIQQLNNVLDPIKAFKIKSPQANEVIAGQLDNPLANVTNFQITSKPRASYTDRARNAGTQGTVRLMVILGKDRKVGPIIIVRSLPNGLTEQAIAAARKIRFEPKIVNGEPRSVIVTLEYGFNIY